MYKPSNLLTIQFAKPHMYIFHNFKPINTLIHQIEIGIAIIHGTLMFRIIINIRTANHICDDLKRRPTY